MSVIIGRCTPVPGALPQCEESIGPVQQALTCVSRCIDALGVPIPPGCAAGQEFGT
jgi:hypothetical protein